MTTTSDNIHDMESTIDLSTLPSIKPNTADIPPSDLTASLTSTDEQPPVYTRAQKWTVLFIIVAVSLVPTLDQNITGVAAPAIAQSLGRLDLLGWLAASYTLTTAAVLPLYSTLSNIYGRHNCIQAALGIFMLGSVIGGTANNMVVVIIARAIQGLGFAGLLAIPATLLSMVTTPHERGYYLAVPAAVFLVCSVAGPVFGGLLVSGAGWRWLFWLPVVLQAPTCLIVWYMFKRSGISLEQADRLHTADGSKLTWRDVDWLGSITICAATASLMVGITMGGDIYPWISVPVLLPLLAFPFLLGWFLYIEHKAGSRAIIPLVIFNTINFNLATLLSVGEGAAAVCFTLYLPAYYQAVHGDSPLISGLRIAPYALTVGIGVAIAGRWLSRTGKYKWQVTVGCAIQLLAMVILVATWATESSYWLMAVVMVLFGVGQGATIPCTTVIATNSVLPSQIPAAVTVLRFTNVMAESVMSACLTSGFDNSYQTGVAAKWPISQSSVPLPAQAVNSNQLVQSVLGIATFDDIYSMSMQILWFIALGVCVMQILVAPFIRQVTLRGETSFEPTAAQTQQPQLEAAAFSTQVNVL